jgi:hypothetical protein
MSLIGENFDTQVERDHSDAGRPNRHQAGRALDVRHIVSPW